MAARHFLVFGRVQGVGFRYFAARSAVRCQVKGWVRNLPDGSVEAWAEGTPEALEEFKRELTIGPMYAEVSHIQERQVPPTGRYIAFRIE